MRRTAAFLLFCLVVGVLAGLFVSVRVSVGPNDIRGSNSQQPLVLHEPTPGTPGYGEKQNPVEQQSDWPWCPGSAARNSDGTPVCPDHQASDSPLDCSSDERCTINPTNCRWDVDDHWQLIELSTSLAAETTVSMTSCMISDANPQYVCLNGYCAYWSGHRGHFGVWFSAPSPDLAITVTYTAQGRTFAVAPVYDASRRGWVYRLCVQAVYNLGDPSLVPITGSAYGTNGTDGLGVVSPITLSVSNPTRRTIKPIGADINVVGVGDPTSSSCISGDTAHASYPFTWSP